MVEIKPSFKKIISNNKLIKGLLRLSTKDLSNLYSKVLNKNKKAYKELEKKERSIQIELERIKKIKIDIKYNLDTIQKGFYTNPQNISLSYKKIGKNKYVKARIYWHGKQREVQVGSIPNIMKLLQDMIQNNLITLKTDIPKIIKWEKIKENQELLKSIKGIAALKFQDYIIRQLLFDEKNTDNDIIKQIIPEKVDKVVEINIDSENNINSDIGNEENWYVDWRKNNLG